MPLHGGGGVLIMKKGLLIFLVIAILFPILLNIIIGFEHPQNIFVIGTPSDWLLFYGSYIGGVLTAIIGYIVMCRSENKNKIQIQITEKQKELNNLKQTLAERIGLFDYNKVIEISLFYKFPSEYNSILRNLNNYQNELATKANAWAVIYAHSRRQEIERFKNLYIDCCLVFTQAINDATHIVKELASVNQEDRDVIALTKITPLNQQSSKIQKELQQLFMAAQEWIAADELELNELRKEL